VLWTCEDILLGSDLEVHNNFCNSNKSCLIVILQVWNCAIVLLHQHSGVATLYAFREYYDKYPKFSFIVRDSVRMYRLNDINKQQIAVAIKSSIKDGPSFTYSLLFHHHWYALSFSSVMIDCGAVYVEMPEESTAEAACAAIAAHLSFNDFSDTLDSALQLIEETDKVFHAESEFIVSTRALDFLQRVLTPENVVRMKYFSSIKFCKKLCAEFSEAEMDPTTKSYWKSAVSLFSQILNVDNTLAPFYETIPLTIGGDDVPVQSTEQLLNVLRPSLELVLKSLELPMDSTHEADVSSPSIALSQSQVPQLVSRSDSIEKYWQSLAILCEEPPWPPYREFVRFDFTLHRKTSHFMFSKRWCSHFFACRGRKLYYQSGSSDTKEGLERFIASKPQVDYKYCVPLSGILYSKQCFNSYVCPKLSPLGPNPLLFFIRFVKVVTLKHLKPEAATSLL
jgi:hypothetical protein